MNAIPTKYNGVQFRSRLEARWAAFFDLAKLKWEYEPIDLAGYIPDFLVTPECDSTPTLFEVKPLVAWPCPILGCDCGKGNARDKETMDSAILAVQRSGWTGHAVVAGASFRPPGQQGVSPIATPIEAVAGSGDWFDTGSVLARCRRCAVHVLVMDVEGCGRGHCGEKPCIPVDPVSLWREAGNRVQWRGAGARP